MIRHEHIGVHSARMTLERQQSAFPEDQVIFSALKERRPVVSTLDDVLRLPGSREARETRHDVQSKLVERLHHRFIASCILFPQLESDPD